VRRERERENPSHLVSLLIRSPLLSKVIPHVLSPWWIALHHKNFGRHIWSIKDAVQRVYWAEFLGVVPEGREGSELDKKKLTKNGCNLVLSWSFEKLWNYDIPSER
jgi:hypothetical protein